MNDVATARPPAKKKSALGKVMPVIIGLAVGAAGVGGGLYVIKPGLFSASVEGPHEDPNAPKKVKREGAGEGRYEASYFALSQPFTSNLKDSNQFVQLSISLGTFYDETFVETLKTHEMALRSAALLVIADETYATASTMAGKQALAAKLKDVLNKTLKERGETPGIDTVYFTGFVVQ